MKITKILRMSYIKLPNCLFVRDVLTNLSIPPFQNYFIKSDNLLQYNTTHVKQNSIILNHGILISTHKVNTAPSSNNMK